MKYAATILILAAAAAGIFVALKSNSIAIVNPTPWHLTWPPGDYTNFLIYTTFDLHSWQLIADTQETNIEFIPAKMQFFGVIGTNKITGEWAVAGSK